MSAHVEPVTDAMRGESRPEVDRQLLALLDLATLRQRGTLAVAVGVLLGSLALFPLLGKSFMPVMKEGALTPQINRVPSISTRAKLRLVNGLSTTELLSALVSSATTGTGDVASGQVSNDIVVPAAGSVKIDVSSDRKSVV